MKFTHCCLLAATLLSVVACGPAPNTGSFPLPYPMGSPSAAPSSLAALFSGQIVSTQEQQLRDIQTRKIVLNFPLKVGVIFYNLQTKLEDADLKAQFDLVREDLKKSGQVRETIQIPNSLLSAPLTIDEMRTQGARFQCDIMVLVTGSSDFSKSKTQSSNFFDSFSNKLNYESKVKLEAIALDVYTGTLLSPFDAAITGKPTAFDRTSADYYSATYNYQKETETKAWDSLRKEAVENIVQLRADVDQRKQEIALDAAKPTPAPSQTPSPSPSPTVSPTPAPTATPAI